MIHELFRVFNWMGSEWVLVILASLSVVTFGVILQRWFELWKLDRTSSLFWSERAESWFNEGYAKDWNNDLTQMRVDYPCLESDLLGILNKTQQAANANPEQVMVAYLDQRRIKLEKSLNILGTIGSNAPFIGLLGTVLGIIRAFHDMASQGLSSGLEGITGGIAEALVATAIGLFVAVPAVVFFNILSKRIATLCRRAQDVGLLVISQKK